MNIEHVIGTDELHIIAIYLSLSVIAAICSMLRAQLIYNSIMNLFLYPIVYDLHPHSAALLHYFVCVELLPVKMEMQLPSKIKFEPIINSNP